MTLFFSSMCLLLSSEVSRADSRGIKIQDLRQDELCFTKKNESNHLRVCSSVPQRHMCIQFEHFLSPTGRLIPAPSHSWKAGEGGETLHLLYTAKQRSPFSCRASAVPRCHYLHSSGARSPKTTTKTAAEVNRNCSNKWYYETPLV